MALFGVGEKVDVGGHIIVHDQRQIRVGCGQIRPGLGDQLGVHNEGHIFGGLRRSGFFLRHKAIALLESFHLERAYAVHNAVELLLQLGVAFDVNAGGEHEVDGAIKLVLGLDEEPLVIVGLTVSVGVVHLLDEHAYALLLTGKRGLVGNGGRRSLLDGRNSGRGGLRRRNVPSTCGSGRRAACEQESQQCATEKSKAVLANMHDEYCRAYFEKPQKALCR